MSDRYYDRKGIGHCYQNSAEMANEAYLREERAATKEILQLHKEERAATQEMLHLQWQQKMAVERMESEAQIQRFEQSLHNQEVAKRLADEAAAKARQRKFENEVTFLKESDEETRAEKMLEIFGAEIDSALESDTLAIEVTPALKSGGEIYKQAGVATQALTTLLKEKNALSLIQAQNKGNWPDVPAYVKQRAKEIRHEIRGPFSSGGWLVLFGSLPLIVGSIFLSNGVAQWLKGFGLNNVQIGSVGPVPVAGILSLAFCLSAIVMSIRVLKRINKWSRRNSKPEKPTLEELVSLNDAKLRESMDQIVRLLVEIQTCLLNEAPTALNKFISGMGHIDNYVDAFRCEIAGRQKVYPSNCRISPASIPLASIKARHSHFGGCCIRALAFRIGDLTAGGANSWWLDWRKVADESSAQDKLIPAATILERLVELLPKGIEFDTEAADQLCSTPLQASGHSQTVSAHGTSRSVSGYR